jgi:hypothetical protein
MIYSIDGQMVYRNTNIDVTPAPPRVYAGVIQFEVPSVLLGIQTLIFPKRNGGVEVHYEPIIEEGFSGAFPCEITEYFTENPTPPSVGALNAFTPKPVSFSTPYGSFRVGPTLHSQITLTISTGTQDPIYEFISQNIVIPATAKTHWAGETVLAAYKTQPYKNGFIVKEYRINL